MLEQQQDTSTLSLLLAPLEHPAFQQGVRDGQAYYFDSYDKAPLTQEEMTQEVEGNLTERVSRQDTRLSQATGMPAPSYLERLGWVGGMIARGLTYVK